MSGAEGGAGRRPRVTLIAAVAANRAIGREGGLPWHLPRDLRRFKELTVGHAMVMGRRTWESIDGPLPKRRIVVVSGRPGWRPEPPAATVEGAATVEEALARAAELEAAHPAPEVFVAGGSGIYRAALPYADRLQLTRIEQEFAGDAFFPEVDFTGWRLTAEERFGPEPGVPFAYRFEVWDRAAASEV
jgi:dihydrofolate reductase